MLPAFFRIAGGIDTVAEWRSFANAQPKNAGQMLADLDWIGDHGKNNVRDEDQNTVGMADLFCRQVLSQEATWGVFYAVDGPGRGECVVSVIMVANLTNIPFGQAANEAKRRKAELAGER